MNTPELPRLPQSLLDAIGEYGMARTDGVGVPELIDRWQQVITEIKRYAAGVKEQA